MDTLWIIRINRLYAVTTATPGFTPCPDSVCSQKPSMSVVLLCPLETSKKNSGPSCQALCHSPSIVSSKERKWSAMLEHKISCPETIKNSSKLFFFFVGAKLIRTQLAFLMPHFQSNISSFSLTCTYTRLTSFW